MPSTNDIIIVGAGIVGCAIGYELARRGASVQIVDDRPVGLGATQASAGVLAPFIEARERAPLLDLAARSLDLFDAFVAGVAADSGMDVTYRRSGTLDVALQHDAMDRLREAAKLLAERGVAAHLLDSKAVLSEEPQVSRDALGGLSIPAHGYVSARQLTTALASAVLRRGGHVSDSGRARRISRLGDELQVETAIGRLRARTVVIAAGSWAGSIEIEGVASVPVRPIRGQLVELLWAGFPLRRVLWSDRCYMVPWPNGTVLVGATVEDAGFDERTTAAGVHHLIEAACDLVPETWRAGVGTPRAGLRPATPDELPIIGRSSVIPNLIFACGHYRNGVLLAPLTASLVADAIVGGATDPLLDRMSPGRFGL